MLVDLELTPKRKRASGERCCEPVAYPDVQRAHAKRMAGRIQRVGGAHCSITKSSPVARRDR